MRWVQQVADRCVGKNRDQIECIIERACYAVADRCAQLHQEYEDADVIDETPIDWSRALEPLR